jgi:hypothetical protein
MAAINPAPNAGASGTGASPERPRVTLQAPRRRALRAIPTAGVRPDEVAAQAARSRAIGLFRYQLIREAADPAHSTRARGRMVREIAARTHLEPGRAAGAGLA